MSDVRIGLVTGANQGLGLAVAAGLARAWGARGTVYLSGRDRRRVEGAAAVLAGDGLARDGVRVIPEVCDVRDDEAVLGLARRIADRHGGVDFVDSNATAGISPGVASAGQVDDLIDTNNLGATRMIRAFGPLLRPGGRLVVTASAYGTLSGLPPQLHSRFDTATMSLDDLDTTMRDYADAVRSGAAAGQGWPDWISIPSKIGQVAAVRIYARERRERAMDDVRLIVAACPGLVNTRASRPWFADMSQAQSPDEGGSRRRQTRHGRDRAADARRAGPARANTPVDRARGGRGLEVRDHLSREGPPGASRQACRAASRWTGLLR